MRTSLVASANTARHREPPRLRRSSLSAANEGLRPRSNGHPREECAGVSEIASDHAYLLLFYAGRLTGPHQGRLQGNPSVNTRSLHRSRLKLKAAADNPQTFFHASHTETNMCRTGMSVKPRAAIEQ